MRFLLGAAYTRFYMRPSYLATCLRLGSGRLKTVVTHLDAIVSQHHAKTETASSMSRAVTC
jgi:hypothetical protein